MRIAQTSHIETTDPLRILFSADWQLAILVYEGLVGYKKNSLQLEPLLAESWQLLDNGLGYRFFLRKDVHFHDDPCFPGNTGRQLTAADVLYTFERLAECSKECPNWYLLDGKISGLTDFVNGSADSIAGVRIIDDYTIEFHLTKRYATFLKILASPTTFILPQEAVTYYGENIAYHPVGTGPFRLVRWSPFEKIELTRNERYWKRKDGRPLPYLNGLSVNCYDDVSLAFSAFLKGETDLFRAGEHFSKTLSETMFDSAQYVTLSAPVGLTVRFFGFSLDNLSVYSKDRSLRRAVSLAFDREKLVAGAPAFRSFPAHTLVPDCFFSHIRIPGIKQNVAAARSLLGEHNPVPPLYICTNIEATDISTLKRELGDVDIPVHMDIRPSAYFPHIMKERPDLFRLAFIPSFPDPEEYYQLFHSSTAKDVNLTGYANPEYDRVLEETMTEMDARKREEKFLELEKILRRDVPAIFVSHSRPVSYIIPKTVRGLQLSFIFPDFSAVYLESPDERRN